MKSWFRAKLSVSRFVIFLVIPNTILLQVGGLIHIQGFIGWPKYDTAVTDFTTNCEENCIPKSIWRFLLNEPWDLLPIEVQVWGVPDRDHDLFRKSGYNLCRAFSATKRQFLTKLVSHTNYMDTCCLWQSLHTITGNKAKVVEWHQLPLQTKMCLYPWPPSQPSDQPYWVWTHGKWLTQMDPSPYPQNLWTRQQKYLWTSSTSPYSNLTFSPTLRKPLSYQCQRKTR